MNGFSRRLGQGALHGVLATGFMTAAMMIGKRLGGFRKHAPEKITEGGLKAIGGRPDRNTQGIAATVAHFAFGAGGGVLFSAMHDRIGPKAPLPAQGVAFALLIWALSYKGWVPALRLLPPPEKDRPSRAWTMLIAHVVYGTALGAMHRRIRTT